MAQSLNLIAKQNGIDDTWENAIKHIVSSHTAEFAAAKKNLNKLIGPLKRRHSNDKRKVAKKYTMEDQLLLPDGLGGVAEAFQHRQRNGGVLITKTVSKLVETDILKRFGGLKNLNGYDEGNIQLVYVLLDEPNQNNREILEHLCYSRHLMFEFHICSEGVIAYFGQSCPWIGFESELNVRGFQCTRSGFGTSSTQNVFHWTAFELLHRFLTPIDIRKSGEFNKVKALSNCFASHEDAENMLKKELVCRLHRLLTGQFIPLDNFTNIPQAIYFELVGEVGDEILKPLSDLLNIAWEIGMERHCYIENKLVERRLISFLLPKPEIDY